MNTGVNPLSVYELDSVLGEGRFYIIWLIYQGLLNDYHLLGSYGCVYKATKHRLTSYDRNEYAIKIIPINSSEDSTQICKEMNSLQRLACPFVVSFVESYVFERKLIKSSLSTLQYGILIC